MNNKNIISNKFDLNWSTMFSYNAHQQEEKPIVESIDLSSLDFPQKDVFEGTRTLDPVGTGVEGEPHPVEDPTEDGDVVAEKTYRRFQKKNSLKWLDTFRGATTLSTKAISIVTFCITQHNNLPICRVPLCWIKKCWVSWRPFSIFLRIAYRGTTTFSIMILSITTICQYAECRFLFIVMLSVVVPI